MEFKIIKTTERNQDKNEGVEIFLFFFAEVLEKNVLEEWSIPTQIGGLSCSLDC